MLSRRKYSLAELELAKWQAHKQGVIESYQLYGNERAEHLNMVNARIALWQERVDAEEGE